jgi:hypothetical protein
VLERILVGIIDASLLRKAMLFYTGVDIKPDSSAERRGAAFSRHRLYCLGQQSQQPDYGHALGEQQGVSRVGTTSSGQCIGLKAANSKLNQASTRSDARGREQMTVRILLHAANRWPTAIST